MWYNSHKHTHENEGKKKCKYWVIVVFLFFFYFQRKKWVKLGGSKLAIRMALRNTTYISTTCEDLFQKPPELDKIGKWVK